MRRIESSFREQDTYLVDLDIKDRFYLANTTKNYLYRLTPSFGFGVLGASVYARTYSRVMEDGSQERWADTTIRVIEGMFTVRKWWHMRNRLAWDEAHWQGIAAEMADAIFHFRFLPAGRHLWSNGTEHSYKLGGMSSNNCAMITVDHLSANAYWTADALMLGVGVGFDVDKNSQVFQRPSETEALFVVPDSREGWAEAVQVLIESYERGTETVRFDFSEVRGRGAPIKGFGGVASGPDPLAKGLERIREYLDAHVAGETSVSRLIIDTMNAIGAFVVSGNVRRSAMIALGDGGDDEFLNFKNYELNPERAEIGWLSNNSVKLEQYDDFHNLSNLAERIRYNGEPGIANMVNIKKYGRYGEKQYDPAVGCNPCAEIPLESHELCLLVETFPTKCVDEFGNFSPSVFYRTLELATIYASSMTLMPTHSAETNAVVARNHRIGVSLSGIADWMATQQPSNVITWLDKGHKLVRETNNYLAGVSGIRESIRVTTVKPSGSISLLAGVSSGMHLPSFSRYIRRVRVGMDAPVVPLLQQANVPYEEDTYSDNTLVFEFPVDQGKVKGQKDVSVWEKAHTVILLQKFWADNMVSNTLTFDPKTEGGQLEGLLAFTVPWIKTISLLPLLDEGSVYAQAPIEQITLDEVNRRKKEIKEIDWDTFGGSDGMDSKFCDADGCET